MSRGVFIVLEGGEASGKSTQCRMLAAELDALPTFEPGATPVGAELRTILLGDTTDALAPWAEALLMIADRAQHVASVIEPSLAAGRHVVCDRYSGSTLAYQGSGRGLDVEQLRSMSAWATGGLEPDVVVLLDVPAAEAAARRRAAGAALDRMESEEDAFHERVADGFRWQAGASSNWVVVDGVGTPDEVAARVAAAVRERLGL
jgi:dTMP kinase